MNPSLKPASLVETSAALQVLFDALPFQRGSKTDNVAAAYVASLGGCSADAINAGISKFLRGECDVSPRFVPTPPELSRIVRSATMAQRIPPERHIAQQPEPTTGERARMRLKMPMWQAAYGITGRMDQLAKANAEGFASMVVLAANWGVPIPPELFEIPEEEAERQWINARNRAWAEIERNPPPFMRNRSRRQQAA